MNFGLAIMRQAMVDKNWSQRELARRCGVDRTTINKICNGVNKPSVPLARKLGELLEIEWSLFFIPLEEGVDMLNLNETGEN